MGHGQWRGSCRDARVLRARRGGRAAQRAPGQLEFERTKEIILRDLPPLPAAVADIGGGPGAYACWLAQLGYRVVHRDLMPLHLEQLRRAAGAGQCIETAVADARQLDLAGASADTVLLLGPLYHLARRSDRLRALAEARRVVRPGGPVFAAAISPLGPPHGWRAAAAATPTGRGSCGRNWRPAACASPAW
jgi:SAM-dependent methyltransferase